MTTTTAPRTRRCRRCSGTGHVDTAVVHMGIPGLCLSCNGSGRTRVRTAEEIAADKAAAAWSARESAAYAAVRVAIPAQLVDLHDQYAAEDGLLALRTAEPARFRRLVESVEAGRLAAVVAHLVAYNRGAA